MSAIGTKRAGLLWHLKVPRGVGGPRLQRAEHLRRLLLPRLPEEYHRQRMTFGPSDFLGRVGDGSHRRHREDFRNSYLTIGPVVCQPGDHLNNHFCPIDCLSGIHVMLRHTCVKPAMPSARAAACETSMTLPLTKGPRSVIRTTAQCPFSWLSTWTNVPNGSVRWAAVKSSV